ncbi:hypothetical protein ACHAXH_009676 [Discostella pseudostelligera]
MLPLRLSSNVASNIVRSFSNVAATKQQQHLLPSVAKASAVSCRLRSNTSNSNWVPTIATSTRHRHASIATQFRYQSSFRNTTNNSNKSSNNNNATASNSINTLSTLSNIFAAGLGTFASTLAALYLATIVETSAHEFLYEYFPHMYADIPDDSLPHCLINRELARRVTGLVVLNRSRGVGMEGAEEESMMLMGMDGWMEQPDLGHDNDMIVAQQGYEKPTQQETRRVSSLPSSLSWERRMMDNRARIIENEEKEFTRGFIFSTTTSSSSSSSSTTSSHQGKTNRFMEKVQAEATRKFQEQLTSVAMTA